MNEQMQRSLSLHFKAAYRGQKNISIKELTDGLEKIKQSKNNKFIYHAIKNKNDVKGEEDKANIPQLLDRINKTLLDPKDSIFLEAYFSLIDTDNDGFISFQDLTNIADDLSQKSLSEADFRFLTDQITEQGTKINKKEFFQLIKNYI